MTDTVKPKKDYPGTIYKPKNCKTLYVKVGGLRISTGLPATEESVPIAKEIAWRIYMKSKRAGTAQSNLNLTPSLSLTPSLNLAIGQIADNTTKIPTIRAAYAQYERISLSKKADNTRQNYVWAYENIITNPMQPCKLPIIKEFAQDFVDTSSFSIESIATAIRNLNPFIVFAQKRGLLYSESGESIPDSQRVSILELKPRVPKRDVVPFQPNEVEIIVEYFEKKDPEFANLIRLLYATGFRINEAITLTWAQIDNKVIRLRNKITKDAEYFPITDEVSEILSRQKRDRERVFRWNSDTTKNTARIYKWLRDCLEQLDIPRRKEKSFHSFRKAFAMKLWRANLSTGEISSLMRHKDITTTMKLYSEFEAEKLAASLNVTAKS